MRAWHVRCIRATSSVEYAAMPGCLMGARRLVDLYKPDRVELRFAFVIAKALAAGAFAARAADAVRSACTQYGHRFWHGKGKEKIRQTAARCAGSESGFGEGNVARGALSVGVQMQHTRSTKVHLKLIEFAETCKDIRADKMRLAFQKYSRLLSYPWALRSG